MQRSRRDLLASGTAGLAALLAGCAGLSGGDTAGDGPSGDRPGDEPTDTSTPVKIDDWQLDPETFYGDGEGGSGGSSGGVSGTAAPQATYTASADGVGAATGGAKSVATFRRNVEEGYLPLPSSLSYEGLFYDYYFDTGSGSCGGTFCPRYATAVTEDPLSGETERYLTVGLDSGLSEVPRKPLNLAVVLDVSGSMSSEFAEYYYDRYGNKQEVEDHSGRRKIDVAADAIAAMTTHLRPDDRFGMAVFNDEAAVAKPVRRVAETDMAAIRDHLQELEADGGTRLSAGIETATELLAPYDDQDRTERETRSIVVTDAMPNLGTTDDEDLQSTLSDNAAAHHYTTFVGVGVDFNTEIVDAITAVEGANYYPVHSADEFERRMADEFEYVVTPIAFDLSVTLSAPDSAVAKVYGSTTAEDATAEVLGANTLFASPQRDGRTRGGVILVQLSGTGGDLSLEASWETRDGRRRRAAADVSFPDAEPDRYGTAGVRKAVLLSRYADLLKNWMVYERDQAAVDADGGIGVPPGEAELGEWEQQSVDLTVSERYRRRIDAFDDHFQREMAALGDDALKRELEILRKLASYGG